MGDCAPALPVLEKWLNDARPTTALYAARTIQLAGSAACSLAPQMQRAITVRRDVSTNSGYIDFNYNAFTGWALEEALKECGLSPEL